MTDDRRLDGLSTALRWGLAAIAAGIVLGATLPAALSGLGVAWDTNRQALVWLFERVFGFMAYLTMTASVVYGLLLTTRLMDGIAHRPISYTLHQDLAAIGIGLAGVHGMLLGLDHSVPFTIAQVLVPGLAPHAPLAVAFGQVALYLAMIVLGSFYLRPHLPQRAWRVLHYVTFLSFVGATVHGIGSGSDSAATWAQWLYLGSAALVMFLLTYRIGMAVLARSGRIPMRAAVELDRVRR
jgi:predicted ferric reductase